MRDTRAASPIPENGRPSVRAVPPVSSLIFVVILAVWAVYLVQHWVRRRDHLATARSVDRFSESMRVLERRRALPRPDLVEHAPPSTSVLLRPARPEVVVKRGATPAAPAHTVATAVGPTATFRRAQLLARVRAAGLLAGSVVMLTLVGLTIAQVLHWGWSFAGLAVLAGTVAVIRWSVSHHRTARRPAARSGRRSARVAVPARTVPAESAQQAEPGPRSYSPLAAQARASVAGVSTPARRAVDLDRRPAPVLYDIDEVETALTATPAPATEEVQAGPVQAADGGRTAAEQDDLTGGSWSPVPVPPPTYTLKARAHRGSVPTASGQLPLDGTEMALDEEFEELPSVDRVG